MAYAAQYGSQLELRFSGSGYTPPTGSAVALRFVSEGSTTRIRGTTRIFAVATNTSSLFTEFSILSGSTPKFEQPYRSFAISGGSEVQPDHPLRPVDFWASTTSDFQAGTRLELMLGSAVSFSIRGFISTAYSIPTNSVVDGDFVVYKATSALVPTKTTISARGGFNAMTAMWVFSGGKLSGAGKRIHLVDYSIHGRSSVSAKIIREDAAALSASSLSVVSMRGVAVARSGAALGGASALGFVAIPSVRGAHTVAAGSSCSFSSDYSTFPVPLIDTELTYARTKKNSIYVLA